MFDLMRFQFPRGIEALVAFRTGVRGLVSVFPHLVFEQVGLAAETVGAINAREHGLRCVTLHVSPVVAGGAQALPTRGAVEDFGA